MVPPTKLPSGWQTVALSDIAEVRLGRQRSPAMASGPNMKPYLRAANITWQGLDLKDVKKMQFSPAEVSVYSLKANDIVLNEASGSADEVGKPAIWNCEIEECCFQNTIIRIRPKKGISHEYIYYHFLHDARLKHFAAKSKGTGIRHLGAETLSRWHIVVPPSAEQRRIVTKIDAFTIRFKSVRDSLSLIQDLLGKLRQALLTDAFRGVLTANWRCQNPDTQLGDDPLKKIHIERRRRWEEAEVAKFMSTGKTPSGDYWKQRYPRMVEVSQSNAPYSLPPGWRWTTLDELSWSAGYGTSEKCDYDALGTPVLRIPNVAEGRLVLEDIKRTASPLNIASHDALQPGDFLIVRTNGSRNLIARAAAIYNGMQPLTFFASYLIRYRLALPPTLVRWVEYVWESEPIRRALEDLAATSAGQYNINMNKLDTVLIPLPPLKEASVAVDILDKCTGQLRQAALALGATRSLCSELEQKVLIRAFSGELVQQDPNDAPASDLIAKLRAEIATLSERQKRTPTTKIKHTNKSEVRPERKPLPTRTSPPASPKATTTTRQKTGSCDSAATADEAPAQTTLFWADSSTNIFLLPTDAQLSLIHGHLVGEGSLEREEAIRTAAERLRDAGHAEFIRLRRDGPLFATLDAALTAGLKAQLFDRPHRGQVRAIVKEPTRVPASLWQRALLAALGAGPLDADAAVQATATWAQTRIGLEFKRLRAGGHIDMAVRKAIAELVASGALIRDNGRLRRPPT